MIQQRMATFLYVPVFCLAAWALSPSAHAAGDLPAFPPTFDADEAAVPDERDDESLISDEVNDSSEPVSEQSVRGYPRVYQGDDYASANGGWVEACDMERDGHGVYIEGYLYNGTRYEVRDRNGSSAGCGNDTFSNRVWSLRVCEDLSALPDACSGWAYQR